MKTLFMLMLTVGFFSPAAHAVVGEKVSGAEDCAKVMQQAQEMIKHNEQVAGSGSTSDSGAPSGGATIAK